jgi:purine-binding chemotaxis protein CheW
VTEGRRRSEATTKSLVGFRVGGVHYAADIMRVREIVNPLPLVSVPHAPAFVLGVADHRGNVIPIVDLRSRFGLPPDSSGRGKWILAEALGRDVGLSVDEVTQVFGRPPEGVRPPPELARGPAGDFVHGVMSLHGELVFLLDLDRLAGVPDAIAALGPGTAVGSLPPGRS